MKKYLFILIIFISCQDNVSPIVPDSQPKEQKALKSARLAEDCETTTYNNGLVADECEVGMGGTLIRDTFIDADGHFFRVTTDGSIVQVGGGGAAIMTDDGANDIHTMVSTNISGIYPQVVIGVSNFYGTRYDYGIVIQHDGIHISYGNDEVNKDLIVINEGNIIFPELKNYTLKSSLPSKALYDSLGFVKRKK